MVDGYHCIDLGRRRRAVYLRDGADKVLAILTKDLELLVGMLPKMVAGCLIAAFVTRLVPREVVTRVVGAESDCSACWSR